MERYTKEELKTIAKFLNDAEKYEKQSKKHWLKCANKALDDDTLVRLANQSEERLAAVRNYQAYVGCSLEVIEKNDWCEQATVFIGGDK